jgi:hypothetical protein
MLDSINLSNSLKTSCHPSNQSQEGSRPGGGKLLDAWVEKLQNTEITHYRNIHHPWQFSPEQQQVLQALLRCQSTADRLLE